MRFRSIAAAFVLAAIGQGALSPASAAVNLIQNGGFEEPVLDFEDVPLQVQVPGWSTGFVHVIRDRFAYEGKQWLLMGTLFSNPIPTVAGQDYRFSFAFRNPLGFDAIVALTDALSQHVYLESILPATSMVDVRWQVVDIRFTAVGSVAHVFLDNGSFGQVHFDGFSLTAVSPAVPEPATWAMMLIGFAGLGMVARRRERAASG